MQAIVSPITYAGPFDLDERGDMANVVLVYDLADHYQKDRSSFLKMLKRNDLELLFITDPISGQRRRCVTIETAKEVRAIMEPEHEVLEVDEVFK